jgi:hypothetical protein
MGDMTLLRLLGALLLALAIPALARSKTVHTFEQVRLVLVPSMGV